MVALTRVSQLRFNPYYKQLCVHHAHLSGDEETSCHMKNRLNHHAAMRKAPASGPVGDGDLVSAKELSHPIEIQTRTTLRTAEIMTFTENKSPASSRKQHAQVSALARPRPKLKPSKSHRSTHRVLEVARELVSSGIGMLPHSPLLRD